MASVLIYDSIYNPNSYSAYDTIEVVLDNQDKYTTTSKIKNLKGFYIYAYNARYFNYVFDDVAMAIKGKDTPIYLTGEYFLCSTRMVLLEKCDISNKALDNWIPF